MQQFDIIAQKQVLETIPFTVEELNLSQKSDQKEMVFHRLICPEWVNVLGVTSEKQAILIQQSRAGLLRDCLETPGGAVDPDEINDPTRSAIRELEEETGYTSQRILSLAKLPANPAINSNFVHYFLALNCSLTQNRQHHPDEHEQITISHHPVSELEQLVRLGQIDSSYSAMCIMLALKYL